MSFKKKSNIELNVFSDTADIKENFSETEDET